MSVEVFIIIYTFSTDHQNLVRIVCVRERAKAKCNYYFWIYLFQKLDTSHCRDIFIFLDTQPYCNLIYTGVTA